MSNFDESKVNRDHGKFAPRNTSETDLDIGSEDAQYLDDIMDKYGPEDEITLGEDEVDPEYFESDVEIRRSASGFNATTVVGGSTFSNKGDGDIHDAFLRSEYGASDVRDVDVNDGESWVEPEFTAPLDVDVKKGEIGQAFKDKTGMYRFVDDNRNNKLTEKYEVFADKYAKAESAAQMSWTEERRLGEFPSEGFRNTFIAEPDADYSNFGTDEAGLDKLPLGQRVPKGGSLHVEWDEVDDSTGNFVGGADIHDKGTHLEVQTEHEATIGPFGDAEVTREDVRDFWKENSDGRDFSVDGSGGTYSARVPVTARLRHDQGTGDIREALSNEGFVGFDNDADDHFAEWMQNNGRW